MNQESEPRERCQGCIYLGTDHAGAAAWHVCTHDRPNARVLHDANVEINAPTWCPLKRGRKGAYGTAT